MVRLPTDLYHWWNAQDHISSMRQMAFDHISIPAMSAETERVFSDTKLFISDLHSRLGPEIIEALECIRKWILARLWATTLRAKMGVISLSQTRLYSQFSFAPKNELY
jgi:hypothetical protein